VPNCFNHWGILDCTLHRYPTHIPSPNHCHHMCLCQGIGTEESLKFTFIHKGSTFHCFMLSTCAKLLQSLRYFGLHFPQVPHTYSVSQPLSSHVSLSRSRHRRIAEIHVQDKGSKFHWFYAVNLCKTAWMIDMWDRISKVFLCSLSSDPHNIPKTSIVTCYTYTQNLNYNTVHVYGKLEF
jgi:hypothetical protein